MARRIVAMGVSVGLLVALVWWLGPEALWGRLAQLRPGWVAVALAISVPQVALSAWRWRLTGARLGLELPFGVALREYYVATFLNQVLPGGVLGDAARAWRHARTRPVGGGGHTGQPSQVGLGHAARTVILERASGQIVMCAVAVLSLASLPLVFGVGWRILLLELAGAIGVVVLALLLGRFRAGAASTSSWWRDAHTALLAKDVYGTQVAISVLVVLSYIGVYLAAARAVGLTTPTASLLPLVAPVLVSMLIPVSVAGWGVREAVAAGLWSLVGLTAVDGAAASAAYGVIVLASSLPGALLLLTSPT